MDTFEIDATIAEKVMGWHWGLISIGDHEAIEALIGPLERVNGVSHQLISYMPPRSRCDLPNYSTNISDAMRVVDIYRRVGWQVRIEWSNMDGLDEWMWRVDFDFFTNFPADYRTAHGEALELPMAICMAAGAEIDGREKDND